MDDVPKVRTPCALFALTLAAGLGLPASPARADLLVSRFPVRTPQAAWELEPGPDGLKVHGYEVQAYGRPSVAEESPVRRPVRRQAGPRQSVWQALVNRLGVAVVVMFFPPTFGTGTPPVDTPNIPEMPVPTLPPPGGVDTPPPGGVTPPPPPPPSGGPTPTPPPVNSAPEPSTFATGLLGSALVGLVLLGGLRKRRL